MGVTHHQCGTASACLVTSMIVLVAHCTSKPLLKLLAGVNESCKLHVIVAPLSRVCVCVCDYMPFGLCCIFRKEEGANEACSN